MSIQSAERTLPNTVAVNHGRDLAIPISPRQILVSSASQYGSWHTVNLIELSCDCRGFEMRGVCRHIEGARETVPALVWAGSAHGYVPFDAARFEGPVRGFAS